MSTKTQQEPIDILLWENAEEDDRRSMAACPSYNYATQTWRDGSDHAHLMDHFDSPLVFCGADKDTCERGGKGGW